MIWASAEPVIWEVRATFFSIAATVATQTCLCYLTTTVVLRVEGYNQASPGPGGNPGQMMGVSGRRGPVGPEGTTNMGTALLSENGIMVMYPTHTPAETDFLKHTDLNERSWVFCQCSDYKNQALAVAL